VRDYFFFNRKRCETEKNDCYKEKGSGRGTVKRTNSAPQRSERDGEREKKVKKSHQEEKEGHIL